MTKSNSEDSDRSSGKNPEHYGTQVSSFGSDFADPPDVVAAKTSRPASVTDTATEHKPPAFGTQFAAPIHQQAIHKPHERKDLPSQVSFEAVSQTRRADPIQLQRLAEAAMMDGSQQNMATRLRSISDSQKTLILNQRSDNNEPVGKSTWDLRIHRRDVQGQISGIVNPIPTSGEDSSGLQSALAVDDDAPEYEVLGQLGAGNMGIVYHARQLSLNRELAIKTLKPNSRQVQHDQAMFVSEAVVTANLVHPNIVPIHDLGRTHDGKLFYSMKKVTGVPWNEVIRERTLEDNLDIFMKLSDAVAYAHSRGVINRDLKPENVVIGNYGEVVVLDWGLAITTELFEKRRSVLVDFRGGAGTPVYMAPELLDEDLSRVGPQSDVYLLGAILFEILEGFPPHLLHNIWHLTRPEDQFDAVYRAVMYNEIEENVVHRGELMQIARKAMSTEPANRYSSVESLQNAIREYRITGRAEELMNSVDSKAVTDYTTYQSAVALYGEALLKWPDNRRAVNGDRNARLVYAQLAQKKGDIDLGLQVVAGQTDPQFSPVIAKLNKTRLIRKIVRGTWGLMTVAAISLSFYCWLLWMQAVQVKDQLVAKNGELADVQQKVDDANAAAQRATDEAGNATAMAKLETKKAEKAIIDGESAKAEAEKAKVEKVKAEAAAELAKKDAMEANAGAELAKKDAMEAKAGAELAKKDAIEAAVSADKYQSQSYLEKINAADELGEYTKLIEIVNDALEKAKTNPHIKEDLLKEKRANAEKNLGNAQILLQEKPTAASISSDGSTVVVYSGGLEKSVTVLRSVSPLLEDRPAPLKIKVEIKGEVKVAVSSDGRCFCLASATEKQFWHLQNELYNQLDVKQYNAEYKAVGSVKSVFFSPDGRHLYIIGNDLRATVEIYEVASDASELCPPQPLARGATANFQIRDIVLLPDESALIAQFENQECFEYRLTWKDGKPTFDQTRLAIDGLKLKIPGIRRHANVSGKPDRLFVSPDGQRLALTFAETVVFLPRVSNAGADQFSFATPEESTEVETLLATYRVQDVQFSVPKAGERRRVATGHGKRYLQLWDLQGKKYEPCDAPKLFMHRPHNGGVAACLRGHSDVVKAFTFANGDADRLLSVGADLSIRTWQVSTYAELVSQMHEFREAFEQKQEPPSARLFNQNPEFRVSQRSNDTQDVMPSSDKVRFLRLADYTLTAGPLLQPPTTNAPIMKKQGKAIYSARFSPDATRFLVGADDLAAHAFDSQSGREIMTASMLGRKDLLFDPSRNMFLEGHVPEISSIRFLPPKGELLLSGDYFGSISVWDAVPDDNGVGFERSRLLSEYSFSEFAVSDDGTLILAGGATTTKGKLEDAKLLHKGIIWRTEDVLHSPSPVPFREFSGQHPKFAITAVSISPASERIVTAGRRGRMVVWNIEDQSVIAEADGRHNHDQVAGIFFESETQFVSAGYDGKVFRSTVSGNELTASLIQRSEGAFEPAFIVRLRPSPDRKRFATSEVSLPKGTKGINAGQLNVTIWSQDGTRSLLSQPIVIPNSDQELAFRHDVSWSSDGRELMLVQDGVIRIFETAEWKLIRKLEIAKGDSEKGLNKNIAKDRGARPIRGAFAPAVEGRSERIATFDGRVLHMWDLQQDDESGVHVAEFRSHARYAVTASFSSNEKFVATASETLRIFDADEESPNHGSTLYRLPVGEPHQSPLADTAFSPAQGDFRLATIDQQGTLVFWNWNVEKPNPLELLFDVVPVPKDSPEWATGLKFGNATAWSSDGRFLAALQNGIVSMWKQEDGVLERIELPMPEGQQCRFNQLCFSRKEQKLAAGGVAWNETNDEMQSFGAVWDVSEPLPRLIAKIDEPSRMHLIEAGTDRKGITAIAFDDFKNQIVTGGADIRLIRWQTAGTSDTSVPSLSRIADITTNVLDEKGKEIKHDAMITAVDISPTGQVLTADQGGTVILWPTPKN